MQQYRKFVTRGLGAVARGPRNLRWRAREAVVNRMYATLLSCS